MVYPYDIECDFQQCMGYIIKRMERLFEDYHFRIINRPRGTNLFTGISEFVIFFKMIRL